MQGTSVTVVAVREVGPDTIAMEFETPAGFDPLPGQFVLLRAKPWEDGEHPNAAESEDESVARHYTLSSPGADETFEITVGIDPDGELSPWLADRTAGETLHVEGPFGEITYERDRDVVAVAGGPGVGPAISIAEAAIDSGHDAVVIYQDDQPAHTDRLEGLEDADVPVTILPDGDDEALASAVADHLDDGQLYAFGFHDFVHTVADAIDDAGGDRDEALIENFG